MRVSLLLVFILIGLLTACSQSSQVSQQASEQASEDKSTPMPASPPNYYEQGTQSYDGIGKYYQGREISQVMGHLGAEWLERPEREAEEKGSMMLASLALKPTDVVADIGAGSGYFAFRMAKLLPEGKVLAQDIQPEMLEIMRLKQQDNGMKNVEFVLGTEQDPRLPANSVDVAIMVDVYHEFNYPREMMEKIVASLKEGGRIILVEYRGEDPTVPIKPLHKMTAAQAEKEMKQVGMRLLENKDILPRQHILIFGK
ncbi:MAG: class I SAM-dependent methyltransferase [Bacteroidota bacterium]